MLTKGQIIKSPKDQGSINDLLFNCDSACQRVVNTVSAVLDGNDRAVLTASDNRDRLTAVATEREEEGVELLIIGVNADYLIFSALYGIK